MLGVSELRRSFGLGESHTFVIKKLGKRSTRDESHSQPPSTSKHLRLLTYIAETKYQTTPKSCLILLHNYRELPPPCLRHLSKPFTYPNHQLRQRMISGHDSAVLIGQETPPAGSAPPRDAEGTQGRSS